MKKIASQLISIVLAGLVLFFLGRSVVHNWEHIREYQFHFNVLTLIAASVAYVGTFFLLSTGWFMVLRYLHYPITLLEAFLYFCITQPAKYVPGKIWVAIARMKFCKLKGIPNSVTILSTGTESVMEVLGGIYVAILVAPNVELFGRFSNWMPYIATGAGIILMIPRVFYFIINVYQKITRKEPIPREKYVSFPKLLLLQAVYSMGMLGIGVSQYLFLQSFAAVSGEQARFLISIGSLSYVASIIALFTPGGLGVREGFWYLVLKKLITPPVAIIYAFVSRLWTIAIEAILVCICLPVLWFKNRDSLTLKQE